MPIPQLNSKRQNQSWRDNKKRFQTLKKDWVENKASKIKIPQNLKEKLKKNLFRNLAIGFFAILLIGLIFITWISRGLPNPNHLIEREVAQSTKIYDRKGETVLYDIHGTQARTLVNLKDIPEYAKWATIAVEDKNFYKHKGFSILAIARTAVTNVLFGKKAGGSTLTQQFVKNAVLSNEKTYTRKIKELLLAYKIEKRFSKDEILQMYLNEIPYGSTAYGIEAASQKYFSKSVRDINLAEAAILAALPQAPSRYSPYGSGKDLLINRQHIILDLMVEQGYVTQEEADAAKKQELTFSKPTNNIIAPHFVMYIKEILSEKYGETMVEQGGLKIITTLDLDKQRIAEEALTKNTENNEKAYGANNAGLVAIDPKTGQILSMVGSRDYFNDDIDGQYNITTGKRQPGSSLKPLVYATAFLKGYTPDTILYDVVTNFSTDPGKAYEPRNYNNNEYGPVTIRKALAGSLNTPAVKAMYLAGIDNVLDLAKEFGYTTLTDGDRYGLSLVLGGGEVSLLEHTNAYGVFAQDGLFHPVSGILKIEDAKGNVIEEYKPEEKKVLNSNVAREINDVLSDNGSRAYIFGGSNWLTLGNRPVAAKTGTTNDYKDAWTMGYTPSLVAGVWVGNNDNTPMKSGAAGGTVAAKIWHDFMKNSLDGTEVEYFKKPEIKKTGKAVLDGESGLKTMVKIDKNSGLLATEFTPTDQIIEKEYAQPHCILYYVNKDDPLGSAPKNPAADIQFNLWESRVLAWAEKQGLATSTAPTEKDNIHTQENIPQLTIITPENNQTITEPLLDIRIEASAPKGINHSEFYINDNLLDSNYSYPFNLSKRIDFLNNGFHNLKVTVCDEFGNCASKNIEFNLSLSENRNNNLEVTNELINPSNGIALSNIDFPLNIETKVNEPSLVSYVNFYYLEENNSKPQLITKIRPSESYTITGQWEKIPTSGNYKIYSEAITWTNTKIKSEEKLIIINNTEQELKKEEEKTIE